MTRYLRIGDGHEVELSLLVDGILDFGHLERSALFDVLQRKVSHGIPDELILKLEIPLWPAAISRCPPSSKGEPC